ncbi:MULTISPECIES: hybrid sensor histidine kinase/response regulator [Marinobacter]|jgi:signal transduction histidine kinase/ActR/RegA family two-component response regulator|nr:MULTISPECIES: ATP-binding protein [Marinobacter]MCZ4285091.1 ATP-binding protein [Marinobacter salarius]|tara:strand:+ start:2865 stop:5135 length:2271 start_codon:yes stop_codon:yes gene_type:complete
MVLGLVLNIVQVTLDYFSARDSMEQEIRALIEISHSPASQIAYNIDIRLAEELLDGLLRHPATIDARIIDNNGQTMAAASQSSPDSRYRWISDLLFGDSRVFSQELVVPQLSDLSLGSLTVTIDTYHYGLLFLQRAGYTVISGLLKSLVLTAALLFIFFFVLTRPMLNVIGALSRVKAETPEKVRLPVPENHREDEIGLMVGVINQHLETIDSSLAQLRMAESAMKNYSSQLEQEVEDRTREISEKNDALQRGNRALVRAKEDAVRRARARANFLASMSHEIRTPLNGVLGMLGLALEGDMEQAQRNRLEIALNAGQSLLGLLNDILDISKVEAGKLSLENIPFSLRNLVEECATLHAQQARRKNIDVVADIDCDLPESFLGDPTRTRQILNNLLSNAIKFTEQGFVRIHATRYNGNVRIDVVDTGIGMSKEGLHRIFSPFSQADSDTTRLYGGTGLGLTLCRQLVERMHGQILVDSEEHEGTHFTVNLPLPVHDEQESQPSMPAIPGLLQQVGVDIGMPRDYPHRTPIEHQLRAWGIPLREAAPDGEGILMIAANESDETAAQLASSWSGTGIILVDRDGSAHPTKDRQILSMPLRREQLYRTLCRAAGLDTGDRARIIETPAGVSRTLNLLLVEDNQVNQVVASSMLKKLGHTVTLAENGKQALEALQQSERRFDIVLMDCQMPVMDGYEATRNIRENPEWQDLPVIAVTANVMQGDRDDCLESGMNDYITKPYNRADLKSIIDRWAPPQPPED